jgi:formyl-CoA transferase
VGNPIKMSDSPTVVTRSPLLGEHTEEVLRQLGYGADELETLRAERVI